MRMQVVILGMFLVGTSALAQKTWTLPVKGIHSETTGLGMIVPAKTRLPTRQQCLYSTKDLPQVPIAIREVAFQPSVPRQGWQAAFLVTLTLDMSIGPRLPRKYSTRFSLNHGKNVTRVFSGSIQISKITSVTKPGWHFRIPLRRPFILPKLNGSSLVLDFHTTSVVSKRQERSVLLQGTPGYGSVKFQGVGWNCHFQKRRFLAQYLSGRVVVGAPWHWSAVNLRPGSPGFLILGDGGFGSKWAGLTLPIDLKWIGAPGCTLDVRPYLLIPFVVDQRAVARIPALQIPKDPRLVHARFFFQGAYAYPKANTLGWLFLSSLEQRIGSGEDHHAASLATWKYTGSPRYGSSLLGDPVPWCRITY